MSRVKICPRCGSIAEWDSYFGGTRCTRCDFVERPKPSKADRIRAMTDEELAEFINDMFYGLHDNPGMCDVCDRDSVQNCKQCWLEWLKGEAEPC